MALTLVPAKPRTVLANMQTAWALHDRISMQMVVAVLREALLHLRDGSYGGPGFWTIAAALAEAQHRVAKQGAMPIGSVRTVAVFVEQYMQIHCDREVALMDSHSAKAGTELAYKRQAIRFTHLCLMLAIAEESLST